MRLAPFGLLGAALATAMLSGPIVTVEDREPRPRDPPPEPRKRPEPAPPRVLTWADHERLRMADERRARKVARQAKGFAPAQASTASAHTSEATVALREPEGRSTGNATDLPPNSKGIL